MPILHIILILVIVGVVLWLVNTYVPMPAQYKTFINIAIIILLAIWLLSIVGAFSGMSNVTVGGRG